MERAEMPDRDLLVEALQRLMAVQATELGPALREAADAIHAATGAEKVDIFLREEALSSLVAVGVSDTPLGARQRALGLDRLPIANGGRIVQVFQTGMDFMTGHADSDPEELAGIVGPLGVRSTVAVPFEIQGSRRGVLALSSSAPDAFPDHVLRFTRAIAGWVAVIAHRAEVVERLSAEASDRGRRAGAEELVTVVAHDLRNYLTPVHGRIMVLKQRAIRDELEPYRRDAEAAERSLRRLANLVTELLDVGRIEQGLFQLAPVPVDVVSLVREVVGAIEAPGVTIAVRAEPAIVADADPVRLRQALENLLSNAQHHSPAGTTVRVDVSTGSEAGGGAWAVIAIADSGPGMDADLASRVFTRFSRGADSRGLGLGLYLAREIAVAHGGSLELATAPGEGSTFTLRLRAHPR
jgi:two-component system, OmpR family, sensor kinase